MYIQYKTHRYSTTHAIICTSMQPRQYLEKMSRYDLLLGVASADATELLTDDQLTYGISAQERNMILSDFVAECYKV